MNSLGSDKSTQERCGDNDLQEFNFRSWEVLVFLFVKTEWSQNGIDHDVET